MISMLIFLVIMGGVFYFFLIRPQRKRQGEHKSFVDGLQKGDKVITIGGLYGEVDYVGEQEVVLKTEDGGKIKFLKNSIMGKQATD
ncbi:MAG: preprotein translocase subunit YajC [Dehalococcoidia bacterium]